MSGETDDSRPRWPFTSRRSQRRPAPGTSIDLTPGDGAPPDAPGPNDRTPGDRTRGDRTRGARTRGARALSDKAPIDRPLIDRTPIERAPTEVTERVQVIERLEVLEQPSADSVLSWDTVPEPHGGTAQKRTFRIPARYTPQLLSTMIATVGPGLTLRLGDGAGPIVLDPVCLAQIIAAVVLWLCLRAEAPEGRSGRKAY